MVKKIAVLLIAFSFFVIMRSLTALAFQSTSTDLSVCGDVGYVFGTSTSTDFGLVNNGETDAQGVGTSTDFTLNPGIDAMFGCSASSSIRESISLTVSPSTVSLSNLSPGIGRPATSTVTVTITVNKASDGYFLDIQRNSATSTLSSSSIQFPDYSPSWALSGNTCASGEGNATTTPGQNFSFRVTAATTTASYCPFWWGVNDTNGTAMYAGVPAAPQTIVNSTSSASQNGTTLVSILYRADASSTQQIANYSGGITITAIANP